MLISERRGFPTTNYLHCLTLPCTHSATTSTNLTAVFKSWGRIDLFLSSDGLKTAFISCEIFWNTLCSSSVRSRLIPLYFLRILINSSVCKWRPGLNQLLHYFKTIFIIIKCYYCITCIVLVCYICCMILDCSTFSLTALPATDSQAEALTEPHSAGTPGRHLL